MELKNLNTFLQVVESGSFSRAAEVLGYTQSTVSIQIGALEQELGCRLFDRFSHTVSLTGKGKELVLHAQNVTRAVQGLSESFQSDESPKGPVRIMSSDSICEKMMLLNYDGFRKKYPDIQLIFNTTDTESMKEALNHNETDVIFTLDNHQYNNDWVIARESPVRLRFACCPSYPPASTGHLSFRDLREYPLLLTEKGMSYRDILDQHLAGCSLQIDPALESGRTDVLARCAEAGCGITFLPEFVTEEKVKAGSLVYINVEDFEPIIWKQLIYHKNKWLSRAMTSFLDFVIEHEFLW